MTEHDSDAGEVSVEAVVLVPVLFLIALIAVQVGVTLHGISVANHVANQGAVAVARHGATITQGSAAVARAAASLGARLERPAEIDSSPGSVSVRVWVVVPRAVPLFADHVSRRVTVPRERFVTFEERRE